MEPETQPEPQNTSANAFDQPQAVQPTQTDSVAVSPQPEAPQPMQQDPVTPQPEQPQVPAPVVALADPQVDTAPTQSTQLGTEAVASPSADMSAQQFATPSQAPAPAASVSTHDAGHGLAIGSLVTSLLGMGLVAIILGVMSGKKSKASGHKRSVLATVGIVFGVVNILVAIVALVFVFLSYNEVKDAASGVSNMSRINSMHTELEVYRNEKGVYPGIPSVDQMPGIDPAALELADGNDLRITGAQKDKEAAMAVAKATEFDPYIYAPFECNVLDCKGYILSLYTPGENISTGEVYYKIDLDHL